MECTEASHQAMKADEPTWSAIPLIAETPMEGEIFVWKNCPHCHSTLVVVVPEAA